MPLHLSCNCPSSPLSTPFVVHMSLNLNYTAATFRCSLTLAIAVKASMPTGIYPPIYHAKEEVLHEC